uniref:Mitochondrial import inner membrane translocase subunit TIM16 n=1 Tax=Chrysotila carterae TaxID=13221 RepID=A0A7S4FBF3_CHRCT|mmetsp:Transcript_8173/g.17893  ORF Transcript_8173/g.17893 Transcript_8173/m.17893 type:complete len:125 (+) Transcript_8173:191-565(+)
MVGAGLARLFANLLVMGSGVVGRAFMEAYKQALANGGAAAQAAGKSSAKSAAAQAEARQILNVTQKATKEEILEAHEKLTKMNDPEKGGSAYLNAKFLYARNVLAKEDPPAAAPEAADQAKQSK